MIFIDAFVDAYYAYDYHHPKTVERSYTTQPLRTEDPNLNLAHLGVNLKEDRLHGRVAAQTGTAVKANTLLESNRRLGHIQEAYLGYKIDGKTWVDAGIYLGNIGMESWVSKNNFTYSRSLMLDYVPYYSAGVRVTHDVDEKTHLELHLLQGWQNISETNSGKALGLQFKKGAFTYNNFFGDERVYSNQRSRFRSYHDFIYAVTFSERFKGLFSFDFGTQSQQKNGGVDTWLAGAFTFQQKLTEKSYLGYRLEYYSDPHEANVQTLTPHGFRVMSASVNFDYHLQKNVLWRSELREFRSRDKIFGSKRSDGFLVTSLAVSFN